MLAPVVISLAVMLPATFAASDLLTLARARPDSRRARRALRRRAALLLATSSTAATIAVLHWRA